MADTITGQQRRAILALLRDLDMDDDQFSELLGRFTVRTRLDALSRGEAGRVIVALDKAQRGQAR